MTAEELLRRIEEFDMLRLSGAITPEEDALFDDIAMFLENLVMVGKEKTENVNS